ncbi:MAG TPA: YceI family protein [Candidatus Sulfomarinibacteraceae bacterium]|nr:YceI family protein [Candidatus Sulfomarinibacteraceae bacterium]
MSTWTIDSTHSEVTFSARHMMITTVRGKFANVTGSIELDETETDITGGRIQIGIGSLTTGVDSRDEHLRSGDFFDVANHPEATYEVRGVRRLDGTEFEVVGDLTIKGVTRAVPLRAEFLGFYSSMQGARRLGVSASGRFDRSAFGLNWNVALETGGWLVSDEVRLSIEVALEVVSAAVSVAA